jgi:hypothetical protein
MPSFRYSYYVPGDQIDGRFNLIITPCEMQRIRLWEEWDRIRNMGREYKP